MRDPEDNKPTHCVSYPRVRWPDLGRGAWTYWYQTDVTHLAVVPFNQSHPNYFGKMNHWLRPHCLRQNNNREYVMEAMDKCGLFVPKYWLFAPDGRVVKYENGGFWAIDSEFDLSGDPAWDKLYPLAEAFQNAFDYSKYGAWNVAVTAHLMRELDKTRCLEYVEQEVRPNSAGAIPTWASEMIAELKQGV